MKHGVAFRKFSRTSSHRMLMLRNLVTALFEHQQIKTTLPKARDAARLAEKMITIGKQAKNDACKRASAFLLSPTSVTNLFEIFAPRYTQRQGGYTRIHKFGNRPGDNAPHAILELVDNPRDIRHEITSRAVGRELLKNNLKSSDPQTALDRGVEGAAAVVAMETNLAKNDNGLLRPRTRMNLQKVLKFRDASAAEEFSRRVTNYADELLATPMAYSSLHEEALAKTAQTFPPRRRAGQQFVGENRPAISLAKAHLAVRPPVQIALERKGHIFRLENALSGELKHTPHDPVPSHFMIRSKAKDLISKTKF